MRLYYFKSNKIKLPFNQYRKLNIVLLYDELNLNSTYSIPESPQQNPGYAPTQVTASDPHFTEFLTQKSFFSKISGDVITYDLQYGSPQSKILATPMFKFIKDIERC